MNTRTLIPSIRRAFLFAGPLLTAGAMLLLLTGSTLSSLLAPGMVLVLVGIARLVDGCILMAWPC